jgi:ribosomal protein L11 methyltransferase
VRPSPALDVSFPASLPGLVDLVTALLDDFAPAAIHETGTEDAPQWRVFFGQPAIRDQALAALTAAFPDRGLVLTSTDVPDDDWAARSQASLRAVRVGRVVVAPPWDVPQELGAGDALVVIQPSMGFGTGHHETTRLCLALMQEIDCRDRQVLDVGTGSGVLALASAALGARAVEGIDVDPDAVANAEENLSLNPVLARASRVSFRVADLRPAFAETDSATAPGKDVRSVAEAGRPTRGPESLRADIVLANLTGALLVAAASDLLARAAPGASLILSGFQRHEAAALFGAFAGDTTLVMPRTEGEWEAALLHRR